MMMQPTLRTGVDLVEIERLEKLNPAVRQRFIRRVFTVNEQKDAGDSISTLSGRFAAKEAVAKALGCGIGPVSWQEIEILRGIEGEPVIVLHGNAKRTADSLGLITWSISISHSRAYAIAMVVAVSDLRA